MSGHTFHPRTVPHRRKVLNVPLSNRKRRRRAYALTQKLYKQNRRKAYNHIFNNVSADSELSAGELFSYCSEFLTTPSHTDGPVGGVASSIPDFSSFEEFISIKEVTDNYPSGKSSAGPDGVTAAPLRRLPVRILVKLYNLWFRGDGYPSTSWTHVQFSFPRLMVLLRLWTLDPFPSHLSS